MYTHICYLFFYPKGLKGILRGILPFFRFHVTFSCATKSGAGKVHFQNELIRVVANSKRIIYVLYSMGKEKGNCFSSISKVKHSILRKIRFVVFP